MNTQSPGNFNRCGDHNAIQPNIRQFICRALAFLFASLFVSQTLHAQWSIGWIIPPDEGDSIEFPKRDVELPYNGVTYMQTSSDRDYYRFTAPANMKIRVRASGSFRHDPSCIVYSPNTNRVWLQDHDSGPGRDARIKFQAVAGKQYVISVKNRRSGPCRVMIDSPELVLSFEDAAAKDSYGKLRPAPTWEQGTHFGTEFLFGYVDRRVEIREYCLDRVILDEAFIDYGEASFSVSPTFSLPIIVDRTLTMDVTFNPRTSGILRGRLDYDYRVGSATEIASVSLSGIGSMNRNASAFFGMRDHGFNSGASGTFESNDDAAHYHEFQAPVGGATLYRAVVYGIPKRSDRYELVGTVFDNRFGSSEVAAPWSNGFYLNSGPIRAGERLFVKTEISPNDVDPDLAETSSIQFPAGYSVYVYFMPL